ncbi:hypothetical protein GGH94_001854 [Coemansia aciculifera]|uniref:Mitochondrial carrier n=1 Tax=Coemansia aciculifera TaxID=417176 RepID=A0A9W8IQ44_9FUNG|nr:hypothetical protein GGH94_001854 [Coemansia aciculifera]KAJ2877260.1 hypothetical protein GGH93_000144 [Coemansia aciculifera]
MTTPSNSASSVAHTTDLGGGGSTTDSTIIAAADCVHYTRDLFGSMRSSSSNNSERSHYWPGAGGIPPHREGDLVRNGSDPGLGAALAGELEAVGDQAAATAEVLVTGDSERQQQPQRWKNSVAGAGAGCVSSVVTCPLDVAKTRLQYQGVLQERYRQLGYTPYKGTLNTLRRILAEEGVHGLYRGLAPMMMGYLPTWAIYFGAYEALKGELSHSLGSDGGALVHVLSAMGAGGTTSLVTNPIWVLKSRFMTQSAYTEYRYNSMWHAVQVIRRTEGWRGFYKGLGSSLLGVTHVAVQFPLYEHLKRWLSTPSDSAGSPRRLESSRILLASAMSKMVASTVTYPHEVIRTRLQNQTTMPYKYRGILHAVSLIHAEEGMRAFYRGLSTNLIRTVPASMMTLLTYELLIRLL